MRYGFKILSLMLVVAGLCVFLLSGCGAKVCAFGNIGECPKGGSGVNANSTNGGRMSIDTVPANTRDLRWGQTVTLRINGGRPNYTCWKTGPATCTPKSSNTFEVSTTGSGNSDTIVITILSTDFDQNLNENAPKNQGKFAKITFPVYN